MERQDFVDNQIFELLKKLLSPSRELKWNIEMIAAVREAIRERLVVQEQMMSEQEFYPFVEEQI